MGKVEIGIYFCVTADILTKVLLKCFCSSPLPTIEVSVVTDGPLITKISKHLDTPKKIAIILKYKCGFTIE